MYTYTYDGNDNGNYFIFRDGVKIMEVFLGEDAVIDLVTILNDIWKE